MKKKFLLIFLICLFLMPVGVNAGYNGNCTASNNEGLLNDWQWGNASDEAKGIRYTHLAAGNVNYCSNTDESDLVLMVLQFMNYHIVVLLVIIDFIV